MRFSLPFPRPLRAWADLSLDRTSYSTSLPFDRSTDLNSLPHFFRTPSHFFFLLLRPASPRRDLLRQPPPTLPPSSYRPAAAAPAAASVLASPQRLGRAPLSSPPGSATSTQLLRCTAAQHHSRSRTKPVERSRFWKASPVVEPLPFTVSRRYDVVLSAGLLLPYVVFLPSG